MGTLFLRISNIEILLFLNYIWIIGFKFVLGNRVDYLFPTVQVSNKINPNETFLYYFFSYEEFDNFFSFHSIDGKSMIYAHYNTESLPFTISSAEIYKYYLSTGFFITPKVIHNFLHLELKVTNPNGFFWLPQWVVIVFCQEENSPCTFSMAYSYTSLKVKLLPNNTISAYTRKKYKSEEYTIEEDSQSNITIYYTVFSGNVDFSVFVNETKIYPKINLFSTKGEMQYYCEQKCSLKVISSIFDSSYYSLYYLVNQKPISDHIIKVGIVEVEEIRMNQSKSYILPQNRFKLGKVITVYIKTENCKLNVEENENRQLEAKEDNFYQLSFRKSERFTFKFSSFNDNDNINNNDRCVYYIYANKNDNINSIVMIEGVEFENKFTNDNTIINYEFPFIFNNEKNCLLLTFEVSDSNKMYTRIFFENYQYETIFDEINRNKTIFIPEEIYHQYCVPGRLCKILIQIISFLPDKFVKFKIKAKENNIHYIEPNKIITDKIQSGLSWYYYTNIKKGDKGIIQILNKFEKMNVTYKILEKSINKTDIFNDDWIGESDYYTGILPYSADNNCVQGCFLVIRVLYPSSSSNILSEFSLLVKNNNNSIIAPVNEIVKGFFESNTVNYTFTFLLPLNTTKVRVVTKGENTTYYMRTPKESININYTQGRETFFKDWSIKNDDLTVTITAIPPRIVASLFSFYEIMVYPMLSLDSPIHYIKSNSEIECHTGNSSSEIYLIYEKLKNEPFDDILIYVNSSDHDNKILTIYSNPVENTIYSRFLPDGNWTNLFEKKGNHTIKSMKGESFLKIKMNSNYSALFINIEGDSMNTSMKVYLAKSLFSKSIYLIPKENNFHYFHSHSSVKIYFLQNKFVSLEKDYVCKINIHTIFGRGIFIFDKGFLVQGNRIFTIDSDYFSQKHYFIIETSDEEYAVNIQFNFIEKKHLSNQIFRLYDMSLFEFSAQVFPIYLYGLIDDLANLVFNLKIVSENKNYNFSNFQIQALLFRAESDPSQNFSNNNMSFVQLDQTTIEEKEMILLSYNQKNNPQLDYMFLSLQISASKKNETNETNESNLTTFQLIGNNRYHEDQPILSITQKKYIYDKITSFGKGNNKQVYILNLGDRNQEIKKKVLFEFASCSQGTFSFDFKTYNDKISIPFIETTKNGKTSLYLLANTMDQYLLFTLSFSSSSGNITDHYFIMKYSVIDEEQTFPEFSIDKGINNKYYYFNKTIESDWGSIKNKTNLDSVVNSVTFYYYLFEKEENKDNYFSICVLNSTITPKKTLNTSIIMQNDSFSGSGYKTLVIGYFTDSNYEEYLISYEVGEINLSSSTIWIWITIIILVVLLLISFGTYKLFSEISRREKEDKMSSSIEINKNERKISSSLHPLFSEK